MKPKILVAIPCFNCAPQIGRVLERFDSPLLGRVDQVLVIDNSSPDKTAESAVRAIGALPLDQQSAAKFSVLRNNQNYNLGGSFKLAMRHARDEGFHYVVFLHGDDQADAREIHGFVDVLTSNSGLDALLGARFMSGARLDGYSRVREYGNRALNVVFTLATGHRIRDIGSGLNLYRVGALSLEILNALPDHPAFDVDLLLYFVKSGAKIQFIPISWRERDQVSNVRNLEIGAKVLRELIAWRLNVRKEPGRSLAVDEIKYTRLL